MKFKKLPIPFGYVLLAAVLLIFILVGQSYIGFLQWKPEMKFMWLYEISIPFVNYVLWALLTPIIYNILQAYPLSHPFGASRVMSHVFIGLVIAFSHEIISNLMYVSILVGIGDIEIDRGFIIRRWQTIPVAMVSRFIEYWIIVGVMLAFEFYRRYRENQIELVRTENELNNAQLNALKMQLHPHFLFNTLNTISALMDTNVSHAQKVLSRLGDLMRTILDQNQKHEVTLEEEIKYVKNYLEIEQVRFNDRLEIRYEIDPASLIAKVPNLILQPLVENAVKHGLSKKAEGGFILVKSERSGNRIKLLVEDNGLGCDHPETVLDFPGIGLKNTGDRLQKFYNKNCVFKIDCKPNDGFKIIIDVPFITD